MREIKGKLLNAVILIILIIAFGTFGYMIIEGWNFMDSLFMTVITITTVGYNEVQELSRYGEVFTIILLITGVGVILYVLSTEAKAVIEGELREILGRKRVENRIRNLKGHYIICGFGRMGKIIARELMEKGVTFLVIDNDPEALKNTENILTIEGDATHDETLITAGIEQAAGIVTVLSTDAENLFVVLSARELNKNVYIVCRAMDDSSRSKFITAGANRVVSPYLTGSVRIANLILKPALVDFFELATKGGDVQMNLEEIRMNEKSAYSGKTIEQARIGRELGIIILAIKDSAGNMKFNPNAGTVINPGDTLIAIGEQSKLKKLELMASGN